MSNIWKTANEMICFVPEKTKYSICDAVNIARHYADIMDLRDAIKASAWACILKSKDNNATFSERLAELTENPLLLIAEESKSYQNWTGFIPESSGRGIYVKHAYFTTTRRGRVKWTSGEVRMFSLDFTKNNVTIVKRSNKEDYQWK